MSRKTLFVSFLGVAAVAALAFAAMTYLIEASSPQGRNQTRAKDATSVKLALEDYRKARGVYPIGDGKSLSTVEKDLVEGGFLKAIPKDPRPELMEYLYASDGKVYGLLVRLEATETAAGTVAAVLCMIGVGTTGTGIFGEPPPCNF
jgi:hypothetical protein